MSKRIVMLGTSFETLGGISSVVKLYRDRGLMRRLGVRYLESHRDGGIWRKITYLSRSWFQFMGMMLTFQVKLLHVHHASRASFWRKMLFVLPAYWMRIPVVMHLHGGGFATFYEACGPRRRALIRYAYDRAACVIVLSETWRAWVRGMSRNKNVIAVYNPVVVAPETPAHVRQPALVLFLGRIGEEKGCYDLLHACARLVHVHQQLAVCLAGDGDLNGARKLAESLGIGERLDLPGWVDDQDKSVLLRRATIYALPSYAEGLPMSILEAMASGLPIVASNVGGIPEAVTSGEHGLLVSPGDVVGLIAALDSLLSNIDLRERMGVQAHENVRRLFSHEQVFSQIELIYSRLVPLP